MNELKIVEDYVINELRKTIANQGHTLTGSLSASLEAHTLNTLNGYFINFYYNEYGQPLDTGVKPERIPFNPGSGAKTSKYIDALIQYVKRRMNVTGDKEAKGIAFAIAYKHKKEGMSTTASARFSKTGERNNWVNNTLDRIENPLQQLIEVALGNILDDLFYNALKVAA